MSNPIPPLVSSTPPPIDFDEETSANNDTNDDFCEFDTGDTETFEGQSLPSTPKHLIHTINKKLDPDIEATNKTDITENEENKNISTRLNVLETESYVDDVGVKILENNEDVFGDFEKNTENEKSLELVSPTLSDSEDCGLNEKYFIEETELNHKHEIIQSDFESGRPAEGKDKVLNLNSQTEESDLSASKSEPLHSSHENVNDSKNDNITNLQTDRIDSSSTITNVSDTIEDASNTIENTIESEKDEISEIEEISPNEDNICETYIESQWSEPKITDIEESNFTFEADFSQFQSFESYETKNDNDFNNSLRGHTQPDSSVLADNQTALVESKQEINIKESIDDDDEFENFQNYASEIEDNDDFSEFTDFKVAAPPPPLHEISTSSNCLTTNSNLNENIKITLDSMFPLNDSGNSNKEINVKNDCQKVSIILKCVDSADALDFQWSNSTIKQSLVKSIGIDSRNILHGEKWNSSMPRFAANLGFNPLEPLKPVKLDSTPNTSNFLENEPSTSAEKVLCNRSDVPAVEFDWNTSGLVNPLDGIKEIANERKSETLHTTSSIELHDTTIQQLSRSEHNELSCSGSPNHNDTKSFVKIHEDEKSNHTKEYLSTFDANLIIDQQSTGPITIKTNNLENIKNIDRLTYTNYQSSENINISTSSPSNANTFIVPLKETHIFTPSKSDAAVSHSTNISESTGNGKCGGPIDFDYEIAAAGTVIDETVIKKEYRDIEYNPSKFILNSDINAVQLNGYEISSISEIVEASLKNDSNIVNGGWDLYNNSVKNEVNDTYSIDNTIKNKIIDINLTKQLKIETNEDFRNLQKGSTVEKYNNFSKPTIGLSPTENLMTNRKFEDCKINQKSSVDDEFTDFQFVPPSSTLTTNKLPNTITNVTDVKISQSFPKVTDNEKINRTNTLDQMILSPAILLPQSVQINSEPKIDWPEPGIDPKELARIETLFPSSKQNNFHNQASSSLMRTSNNENTNISSINNDDDWSDFISVSAVCTSENNLNTIYCPKSPSKVSKSIPTTSELNNDDEWSDFISSTPTGTNSINSEQFNKISVHNNYYNPHLSQQNYKNIIPNPINCNSNNDQTLKNNKICQYLLNNGNVESKDIMHLNSMPHHQQKQDIINQQNLNKNQLNHHHKISPSISLIPDLGYVAPQNFISIPKTNFQKK